MKNLKLRNLFVIIAILLTGQAIAQDIHFSQFYETPLYRNPALAGIVTGDIRVQSVYRSQWSTIDHAYKTGSLNAEYKTHVGSADDYLTLGMQVLYDKAGTSDLVSTEVMPALNYHKSISREHNTYLSLGFMGGWVERRFDLSKITTNSTYEGRGNGESFVQPKYSYMDGSVGMSLNSNFGNSPDDNYFVGAAYHHFNHPKNSFYSNSTTSLNPKYVLSGGVKLGVSEAAFLTVQADYSRQGNFEETVAGMLYGVKIGDYMDKPDYTLEGGAFLRWNDAIIPTIKLDYHPYSIGFSYDVNVSKLKPSSYGHGGFELSITYIGLLDRENATTNAIRCPRF